VSLSSSSINLRFNPSSQESESSPFNARLEIIEVKTNKKYIWEQKDFRARETLEFDLTNLECPDHYEISFFLDDNLAYRNTYLEQPEILF
jgi:biopolymer transport protein ExbD